MLSLLDSVCEDEVAFGDVCIAAVDATDLEADDVADRNEEDIESRLLGIELCSWDAEVGRGRLLPSGEFDSVANADGEVSWKEALLGKRLSLAVDASPDIGVSLNSRV